MMLVGDVNGRANAALTGIGFTLAGVMSASVANVMQATRRAASLPMAAMLDEWEAVSTQRHRLLDARITPGCAGLWNAEESAMIANTIPR